MAITVNDQVYRNLQEQVQYLTDYVDNAIASPAVSPTVETEAITGGTKVTITDKNGAHEFDVMNGVNGAAGKSAYASAQDGGFTGTESQFNKGLSVMGGVSGIDTTVTQNSGNLITSGAVYTFAKAASSQVTPLFAQSVDELNVSGDTTKLYVLPDGYIYGYINGAWTNTQQAFTSFDMLNKIKDACIDEVSVSRTNYNLLKPSECLYQKRLNTGTTDIVDSNIYNMVSNKIPVEYGKHYTVSREVDGSRVTYGDPANSPIIYRVLVY